MELWSSHQQFNSPMPTHQHIKLGKDVCKLVFNPVELIRSYTYRKVKDL